MHAKLLIMNTPPACVPPRLIASFFSQAGVPLGQFRHCWPLVARSRPKRQKPTAGTPAVPPKQTAVGLSHRIGRPQGMTLCCCGAGVVVDRLSSVPCTVGAVTQQALTSGRAACKVDSPRRVRLSLLFRLRQGQATAPGKGTDGG